MEGFVELGEINSFEVGRGFGRGARQGHIKDSNDGEVISQNQRRGRWDGATGKRMWDGRVREERLRERGGGGEFGGRGDPGPSFASGKVGHRVFGADNTKRLAFGSEDRACAGVRGMG